MTCALPLVHTGEMARPARQLAIVLSLLLSLQWVAAFAHCLAPLARGADPHAVEICTADGLQMVMVGEDGQPPSPLPHTHDSCPLCPGSAAPAAETPILPAVRIHYVILAPPPVAGRPPAPARAPPQQPRAPPIT